MIVLASKSSGRLATLRAAGIEPQVAVSEVDERAVEQQVRSAQPDCGPQVVVQALALAKAQAVAHQLGRSGLAGWRYVVGCDSMLLIDGQLVGKPASGDDAVERWRCMRGRSATLFTGHAVIALSPTEVYSPDSPQTQGVSQAVINFSQVSDKEIAAYVASGEPMYCAGAFTIDGLGGAFIESIEGDPHGVVGLSLPLLRRLLAQLGVTWTDLWHS
jgi:hypothetical protein